MGQRHQSVRSPGTETRYMTLLVWGPRGQLKANEQQESGKLSAEELAVIIELHETQSREADQQAKAKQSVMDQALTA